MWKHRFHVNVTTIPIKSELETEEDGTFRFYELNLLSVMVTDTPATYGLTFFLLNFLIMFTFDKRDVGEVRRKK